jgi:RNA polymerase sigma-70 factor (ECF subfamily)
VQEAWLRLSRSDADEIDNLGGWLTTVVARVCLNVLRARRARPEDPLEVEYVPDPVIGPVDDTDPEREALLADTVGLALLVVLETLPPAERMAFVLHDMFAVPFDDIAAIVDRSPAAARQLASRGRRRVRGAATPDADPAEQRRLVDAFFTATREGNFEALLEVLDPDVVLHSDGGSARPDATHVLRGAEAVGSRAMTFAHMSPHVRPALVNGTAGVVVAPEGKPFSVMAFTVRGGRIVEIHAIADPERLAQLDLERLI